MSVRLLSKDSDELIQNNARMSYVKIIVVKPDALIIKLLKLFNEVTWSMSPSGITLSRSEPEVPYHSRSLGVFFVMRESGF
ncbi:hypothetical protein HA466_0170660 [Hirschfeldia incana]|nr:hypothetical protein HA466_0170660 [Hirschfeldia incana]